MITFTRAVQLLPIFFPILIVVTIFTPYIIAVSLDHVYPFLPCISKTAGFEPEGSIFGFLMFLVALIGLLAIFTRYLQLKGFSQQASFEANVLHKVKWFNTISLLSGVSCILGVVLVANVRSSVPQPVKAIDRVHNAGTLMLFLGGGVYFWFQTLISYHGIAVKLNSKSMFLFRLAVSCIVTITGVVYPFLKDFAYTKYSGRVQLNSVTAAHWSPNEGGWAVQVASNAGEWIDCLSLAIYAASFYKEFQTFSLDVSYVENAELEKGWNLKYSKIRQSKEEEVSDE
ncbi:DNA damage-regulated autophagy modulator protein 1-like [Porites lutea]|uniref:DNA damage-regulated autophagy modulator protein 1-like n=1 Tax=Porites lutea TaxID=51062 RepID=UPI003CC55AF8